jgi:hypothetical protein
MKKSNGSIFLSLNNWKVILEKEDMLLTNLIQKLLFLILMYLQKE